LCYFLLRSNVETCLGQKMCEDPFLNKLVKSLILERLM